MDRLAVNEVTNPRGEGPAAAKRAWEVPTIMDEDVRLTAGKPGTTETGTTNGTSS